MIDWLIGWLIDWLIRSLFNLSDKYQDVAASSGTVTIRESGLYFISAAITLKNAAGKFEVGKIFLHLLFQMCFFIF